MTRIFEIISRTARGVVLLFCIQAAAQPAYSQKDERGNNATLLHSDDFTQEPLAGRWIAEIEPKGQSQVRTQNGRLILDTGGGVTVWFKSKLEGNIRIEYDWTVLVDSGRNDRLSDLNQFWMATNPRNADLFAPNAPARSGSFAEYDSLSLYYVGFGGNTNTTTRFRKYHGDGTKPLLKEQLDAPHLLKPNHTYHIVVTVKDGRTTFSADGKVLFDWTDPAPLTAGWFGFRSTQARHAIDRFRVWKLN
ncbi:MAG: DUF6250 domain-containing protein [Dyadobacter fermentans]